MIMANAMAGLTGLAFNTYILSPASIMEPRYDPAKIIVWMAESYVNLVFSSVEHRYMNTKKNDPITSRIHIAMISSAST